MDIKTKTYIIAIAFLIYAPLSSVTLCRISEAASILVTEGYHSVAADAHGNVYVGGLFDSIDNNNLNNIAKWDGKHWAQMGNGLDGNVMALKIDRNGELYAGGLFNQSGSIKSSGVIKWDGAKWISTGDTIEDVTDIKISSDGNVYALGDLKSGDKVFGYVKLVKLVNGSWKEVKKGFNVQAFTLDNNGNVYAVGNVEPHKDAVFKISSNSFEQVATDPRGWSLEVGPDGSLYRTINIGIGSSIEKWDGASWKEFSKGRFYALKFDKSGTLHAIKMYGKKEYDSTDLVKWNGHDWDVLAKGKDSKYIDYCFSDDGGIYLVGDFSKIGKVGSDGIAKWDGKKWISLVKPYHYTPSISNEKPTTLPSKSQTYNNDASTTSNITLAPKQKTSSNTIAGIWTGEIEISNGQGAVIITKYSIGIEEKSDKLGSYTFKEFFEKKASKPTTTFTCSGKNSYHATLEGYVVIDQDSIKLVANTTSNPSCVRPGVNTYKFTNDTLINNNMDGANKQIILHRANW